ncbi:unnamed protein product [Sphenostylis stenocarpa]|uniref:Protein argonaute N-terminal domain-containing protein n=1 Tax=Sphenostylis stenocarpa TaxID=92480 RepID=A0AA86SAR7_9FABA|nr:unnamed protein product [Sphenostylis stenocarpa]
MDRSSSRRRGRSPYHGGNAGRNHSGGRGGNAGRNSSGGRGGNAGRSIYRGRDSYVGRTGRPCQLHQFSSGNEQGFPSKQQPLNPCSPGASSESHNSHPQTETETGNERQTTHNPDAGSLKISKENIRRMHRPDKGEKDKVETRNLEVNHFLVEFDEDRVIFQYDVDVKARAPPMNIRNKLFSDHTLPSSAYDRKRNIFSSEPLPAQTYDVDERLVGYSVTFRLVKVLELRKLRDYLNGNVLSTRRDVLQGLDLAVKENPAQRCDSFGRCFFPMHNLRAPRDGGNCREEYI